MNQLMPIIIGVFINLKPSKSLYAYLPKSKPVFTPAISTSMPAIKQMMKNKKNNLFFFGCVHINKTDISNKLTGVFFINQFL